MNAAIAIERRSSGIPTKAQTAGDQVRGRGSEHIAIVLLRAHLFHHLNSLVGQIAGHFQIMLMVACLDPGDRRPPLVFL